MLPLSSRDKPLADDSRDVGARLLPLHDTWAQDIALLKAGERLRVTVDSPANARVEGRLAWMSADSIRLSAKNNLSQINLSTVTLIEERRRTAASFGKSVLLGAVGGVVIGGISGLLAGDTNTGDGIFTAGGKAVVGSVALGSLGLIGGTIYGACCSRSWAPVPLPPGHKSYSAHADGTP